MNGFVGCSIEKRGDAIYLHQPDLIKKMLKTFENEIRGIKEYLTPATSGYRVTKPQTEEEKLSVEQQSEYRSGVGLLLFLVKHSRPDLSNRVRKLSKGMDCANEDHMKAMLRAIKYVEVTKNLRLKMEVKKGDNDWSVKGYCDSDYAGDSETRKKYQWICGVFKRMSNYLEK